MKIILWVIKLKKKLYSVYSHYSLAPSFILLAKLQTEAEHWNQYFYHFRKISSFFLLKSKRITSFY